MHPTIKQLNEVINNLIDDGEVSTITIQLDQYGNWTVQILLPTAIGQENIDYYNAFCSEHKLQWMIVNELQDVFMQLSPVDEEGC